MSENFQVPTPRRLPSGSWFIRVTVNNEVRSFTCDTPEECIEKAMAVKVRQQKRPQPKANRKRLTVSKAIDKHIEMNPFLSPSTVKGYHKIQSLWMQDLMDLPVTSLNTETVQRSINSYSRQLSPKTLKNAYSLIHKVALDYGEVELHCKLPRIEPPELGFLDMEQLPIFMNALKGSDGEIPVLLALMSLRRSEILDMTWADVDLKKNIIHVRGAAVVGDNGLVHKRSNKSSAGRRDIPFIIPQLKEVLERTPHEGKYLVNCHENTIIKWVHQTCDKAKLDRVSVHDLRRTFCTIGYFLGIPPKVLQVWGGWESIDVVNQVYLKLDKTAERASAKKFTEYFENMSLQ